MKHGFGESDLSPLLKQTLTLTSIYMESAESKSKSLTVLYPDSGYYSLWIGFYHLIEFFKKNVSNHALKHFASLNLKRGDKVEIFGAVAEYVSYSSSVKLMFGDSGNPTINIKEAHYPYLNRTTRTRLNKVSLYSRKKKEIKNNPSALSRMIFADENTHVNLDWLESQVLIVTGHGKKTKTVEKFMNTPFYGEVLADLLKEGHLIIKPDFEDYKHLSKPNKSNQADLFRQVFQSLPEHQLENDISRKIDKLINALDSNSWKNQNFISSLEELELLIEDDESSNLIRYLIDNHPGPDLDSLRNIKCVVVNSIFILEKYENTIKAIKSRGIPVIVVGDLKPNLREAQIIKSRVLEPEELYYSFGEGKIRLLQDQEQQDKKFIDNDEWLYSKRFSEQRVTIHRSGANPLDKVHVEIQRAVLSLDELPNFKKQYYYYFHPLVYSFKNGNQKWEHYEFFKESFLSHLENSRQALPNRLVDLFEKAIRLMESSENGKPFSSHDNFFAHKVKNGSFPAFTDELNMVLKTDYIEKVTFGGIPLGEPIQHLLLSTIVEKTPRETHVLCWPLEAGICEFYLKKHLFSKFFPDKIMDMELSELKIAESTDINREKSVRLSVVGPSSSMEDFDDFEDFEKVGNLKYHHTSQTEGQPSNYLVKCNIVDLDQSRYLYFPVNSTVLSEKEDYSGKLKVGKCRFDDLFLGGRIFIYNWSRSDIRQLARRNQKIGSSFDKLEHWREALIRALKLCGDSIEALEEKYRLINNQKGFGGNPDRNNISRWLHDQTMLSPRKENLQVILSGDPLPKSIERLDEVLTGYSEVRGFSQSMSSKLKKKLIAKLNDSDTETLDNITITLNQVDVVVQSVKIAALNKQLIEVDYLDTGVIIDEYDYT